MALTQQERNDVAAICHDMARLAGDAAQAARQSDIPLTDVARLIVDAQAKGNEAVRRLVAEIID